MRREHYRLYAILRKRGYSPFQIRVYRAVSSIPWGKTRSYSWVAARAGSPDAVRAAGQALKRNPFPFIIPCHRVIRGDGVAGGFAWGKGLKKRLLEIEKTVIIGKCG